MPCWLDSRERIFAASTLLSVSALNSVDLPTFGSPTMPIDTELIPFILTEVEVYAKESLPLWSYCK